MIYHCVLDLQIWEHCSIYIWWYADRNTNWAWQSKFFGAANDVAIFYYFFKAHQHKAAGRKTRLDIQNYGCNGNSLCYHGVVERNRISSLQSHGQALEKECCLPGVIFIIIIK